MKTSIKRMLCLLVSVCICFASLPIIFGVMADASEPELSLSCENIIEEKGKSGEFGEALDTLRINSKIKFGSAKDFSFADIIELNVFIEDKDALKKAITSTNKLGLFFSSHGSKEKQKSSYADISAQIVNNGWNTVKVNAADFKIFAGDFSWSSVRFIYLGFTDEDNASMPNELIGTGFKYKNVCDVLEIMENKEGDIVLYQDAIINKLGDSENSLVSDIANRFSASFEEKDISDIAVLKADFYISDYKAYTEFLNQNKMQITLISQNGEKYTDAVLKHIVAKKSGWYTVSFNLADMKTSGDFDETKVTGFKIEFKGADNAQLGSAHSLKLIVSNLRGFESEISASAIISKDGKSGVYGDTYAAIETNSEIKLDTPIDATVAKNIAFDFYVEDYANFKKMLEASSKPLYFVLSTSTDKKNACALYEFTEQVKGEGLNRIKFKTENYSETKGDAINLKTVYYAYLSFADETSANSYANLKFNISNIVVINSAIDVKPEPPKYSVEISLDGITDTWGDQYNWTMDKFCFDFRDNMINLDEVNNFEFDIYIEDYDAFKTAVKGKRINFATASSDNKTKTRIRFDFENQITRSGWNHIVLEKTARWHVDTGFIYSGTKWVMIFFQDGGTDINPIADTEVRIANVVGTYAEHYYLPELPENVIAQLGVAENDPEGSDNRGNNAGDYFHYTLDKIYREKLTPVDFSKSNIVEFDIYISDYEKMLEAENDPTDGQNSKLSFVVSSTMPGLWEQYSKPRVYYSSEIDLAPYIKHSGWNHIKIGRSEFKIKNHGVDWSALTAFMIYYRNSSNLYPYRNQNSDLYIKVANIVNTGVVANIPVDKDCELQPDKNAVYISSVEGFSDENGVWNIENPITSTDYKTAGKSSIHKKVNYNSEPADTVMGYIFDSSADLSDLKTLNFDLFIDLPQYLDKPNNKVELIIGNNRFAKDDYYSFNVNLNNIKQGWNKVSLNLANARKVGNPDLKSTKLIMIRFTEIDLDPQNFEEIVFGIDNLRYISSTGNTTLKIEGKEDTENNDAGFADDDLFADDTLLDNTDEKEVVEKVINKTGKKKVNKTILRTYVTDFLTLGIVLGIEAVVLAAGVTLFMIIYLVCAKKKSR